MSKGMSKWLWNTLQLWMEEENLISFGNVLKMSVIKKEYVASWKHWWKNVSQTAGKMNLQFLRSLHCIKSIAKIFCIWGLSHEYFHAKLQKEKVLWMRSAVQAMLKETVLQVCHAALVVSGVGGSSPSYISCIFGTGGLWLLQVQSNTITCTYGLVHRIFLFLPLSFSPSSELFFRMAVKEKSWILSLGEQSSFVYKGETCF